MRCANAGPICRRRTHSGHDTALRDSRHRTPPEYRPVPVLLPTGEGHEFLGGKVLQTDGWEDREPASEVGVLGRHHTVSAGVSPGKGFRGTPREEAQQSPRQHTAGHQAGPGRLLDVETTERL